uniref:Titin n=1 Tax=Sphaeramia orbicularis TaxID=375764 RepID=A0A673ANX2_9TELE
MINKPMKFHLWTLKSPPFFVEKPEGVSVVKAGDNLVFECQVSGSPEISVRWFRDGVEVQQSVKHMMSFCSSVATLQISNVTENDSGKYFCEACNDAGTESCTAELVVKAYLIRFKIENVSTVLGDVAVFCCSVEGSLPLSRAFHNKVASLRIPVCEAVHSGNYTCLVVNEAGQDKCFATLVVKEPPTIQEKPEVVRVTRGDPVCLECRVAGSPQISVGWSKDGKELQSSRKYQLLYEQNCSRLNIKSTEADDAGEYEFRASNSIGTCTCKITLMVLEEILPPTFIKKLKNIQAVMDSVVTIEGKVSGSLPMSVEWSKGRQKISEGFKYKLLQLENTVSLELKLSESSDTGEYSCKVWNSAGSCVSSAVLTAKGQSSDVNAITCRNRALGCITASWMKDRRELRSSGNTRITFVSGTASLEISHASKSDAGDYLCKASNNVGSNFFALHVTVLDLPGPPIGPINILEVTPDHMMIQWRPPKDDGGTPVTNYVVEKKDVKKPWEPWSVVSSGGTSTKAKVSRLEKGREYIVRVRAENKIGIGAGLESPPTIAKHMFNPPGSPGLPECSDITENAVTVSWPLPDYDGGSPISGYVIERREMTGKWIRVNKTPVLDLRYRVSGLFEGNTYEFRVFAENVAGISEPSPTSDPIKATRAITKPGPPGNLKLKDWSKSYADICWTKPTRDGGSPILGYVIEAQKSGTAQWDRINKDLIKMCAYRVPGLIEGLEYRIRVRATTKLVTVNPGSFLKPSWQRISWFHLRLWLMCHAVIL